MVFDALRRLVVSLLRGINDAVNLVLSLFLTTERDRYARSRGKRILTLRPVVVGRSLAKAEVLMVAAIPRGIRHLSARSAQPPTRPRIRDPPVSTLRLHVSPPSLRHLWRKARLFILTNRSLSYLLLRPRTTARHLKHVPWGDSLMQPTGSHAQPRTTRLHQARPPGRGKKPIKAKSRGQTDETKLEVAVRQPSAPRPINAKQLCRRIKRAAGEEASNRNKVMGYCLLMAHTRIYPTYARYGKFETAEEVNLDIIVVESLFKQMRKLPEFSLGRFRELVPPDFLPTHHRVAWSFLLALIEIRKRVVGPTTDTDTLKNVAWELHGARTPALWDELISPDHLYTIFAKVAAG